MRFKQMVAIGAVLSITSLGFLYYQPVFGADEIADLQKQIDARKSKIQDIQKQIETIKGALASKQLEKVSLKNQLTIINGRLQKTQLDITATSDQLEETKLILKQTQLKIAQSEDSISQEQLQIGELVRAMDNNERQTLVGIFAGGQTLSDFFTAQDSFYNVDTQLTRALVSVMQTHTKLSAERAKLETTKHELQVVQGTLETKHVQLASQGTAKTQLLAQTQDSEAKFQKLVADLKRQYAATENEIQATERQIAAKLRAKNIKIPTGDVAMSWPVPSHKVTALFHDPDYPFRNVFEHPGLDIRAAQGTPVRAAGPGIVGRAKNAGMGYSYIILIHNNKISTLYGHISRILVNEDEAVAAGDIIGYSGGTPNTPGAGPFVTGAHLHFEVRNQGIPVNPLDYLP